MDLERELSALAAEVEWPAAPAAVVSLPPRRAPRRRRAVVVLAALAVAVAAAFAVPQSRGAILRFLHLGGVTVELVDRLPAAEERPLGSGLGPVVDREAARLALGGEILLPPLSPEPPLHLSGAAVSLLFLDRGEPVLLTEIRGGFLKKVAVGTTRIENVSVGGDHGLWLSGVPHVYVGPDAPPRLAGDVLVWTHGDLTLRLEGRGLTLPRAQELARSLR